MANVLSNILANFFDSFVGKNVRKMLAKLSKILANCIYLLILHLKIMFLGEEYHLYQ